MGSLMFFSFFQITDAWQDGIAYLATFPLCIRSVHDIAQVASMFVYLFSRDLTESEIPSKHIL